MTKTKLVFIAMALALVAWVGASAASAQDGPSISADPSTVSAAGEHTITITGTGWTALPPIFSPAISLREPTRLTSTRCPLR